MLPKYFVNEYNIYLTPCISSIKYELSNRFNIKKSYKLELSSLNKTIYLFELNSLHILLII